MHGEPALPLHFKALPQANPDAPKGGTLVMGESGGFDSLNPFSTRGRASAWITPLTVETLMARAWDEPFTVYGLLAESVKTDEARTYAEFTLREEARFADGSPVTPEDVVWSFHALAEAHPRYLTAHKKVAKVTITGPRSVRFDFIAPDRELPLILGLRPVLSQADWQGRDLTASGMTAPLGSGPYRIARVDPGRSITFEKRADWWAKDLPVMRGQHNLDRIRVEYFTDSSIMFEAFKAGALDVYREHQAARWRSGYDFGRVTSGQVVKSEIPHQRPAMMTGLVFNTRRPLFADLRVRQALLDSFGFEFINQTLNGGSEPRAGSWFYNSGLAMPQGPATPATAALLAPFAQSLPGDVLSDLSLPVSDGSEANRAGLRRAMALLEEAGWQVRDGELRNAENSPFRFEILLPMGNAEIRAAATIWARSLSRLGITAQIQAVDDAQMTARLRDFDFDMTTLLRANSLSPGNEQLLYWGAANADAPGSRNVAGVKSPAVDGLIEGLLTAVTPEAFREHVRALDRVLMAGRYVIPLWFADRSRLAHDSGLGYPADRLPVYGDAAGFLPDLWWRKP
ncbi:extracellular solute-binding protein [Falsigemmobacter faecalis]|uniref:ABC transporter substrate-binding protein n=1 Tax=Falsigemmobacter faecalis TaxID=2488730 RepID=A0A3P3D8Y2_9RHOB|nr:extracellular solute-binding protein [Falsigemmobacter faecalis]RRH70284.1 ABC transporter substrate-binding protein [Falsigemmobacter faecalis]